MAVMPMQGHAHNVNPKKLSPGPMPQPLFAPSLHKVADSIQSQPAIVPSHDEGKHWLEAEAQLFGGVERESQMHPGSSLFTAEH
jgi:hypothetical protein